VQHFSDLKSDNQAKNSVKDLDMGVFFFGAAKSSQGAPFDVNEKNMQLKQPTVI